MGFNLTMFFADLYEVLESDDISDVEKLSILAIKIEEGYKYAEQCGQV